MIDKMIQDILLPEIKMLLLPFKYGIGGLVAEFDLNTCVFHASESNQLI